MTTYCPDCTWMPVPPYRRGHDGRCTPCRAAYKRRTHKPRPRPDEAAWAVQ